MGTLPGRVLTLLLSHQPPAALQPILETWRQVADPDSLLLAYGGTDSNYRAILYAPKVFIDDPKLRPTDKQRGRQSYHGVIAAGAEWMQAHGPFAYVHLVEFDHLPLVLDLNERFRKRLDEEEADVLAFHVRRIDDTSDSHYLGHAFDPQFHQFFAEMSARADKRMTLAMMGTGSFWKSDAFLHLAAHKEPFPIYFELYLPTLAHHLGYRIRDLGEQNEYVMPAGDFSGKLSNLARRGAWTAHPVKTLTTRLNLPVL